MAKKVLVVDDEKLIVKGIRFSLEQDGMEVDCAYDGEEANVGEMWLTHYSPSLTKPEHYMNDVKKIFPRAKAGKDGMSVDLMFED